MEYYDRVLAIDPNHVGALNNKGIALFHLGRIEEAISYSDRALAIHPNLLDALTNKANALLNLGRYEEAIEHYDRALAIDSDATKISGKVDY
ncbi:MAG: tetratricopeptide repeat protein [Thermoproteota archaeon]|nr:tetratricopeptide repeat protein [Thermoproteota archaeon]